RGRIPTPVVASDERPAPLVADIRSGKPFFLNRSRLVRVARRFASIAALLCLDLAGLVLGVYAALVVRALYYGRSHLLWGVLWRDHPGPAPGARGAPLRAARRLGREPRPPAPRPRLGSKRDRLQLRRSARTVGRRAPAAVPRRSPRPAARARRGPGRRAHPHRLRFQRARAARDRLARTPARRAGSRGAARHRAPDRASPARPRAGRAVV